MNRCIPPDQFHRLLDEQMNAAERQTLEAHVDGCALCQEALARLLEETEGNAPGLKWRCLRPSESASTLDVPNGFLQRLKLHLAQTTGAVPELRKGGNGITTAEILFPDPPTLPGSIGGLESYHILAELGRGAFGFVFKAHDEKLDCPVAIKVLKPELAASVSDRSRFEAEARKAAAVRHDHVVAIHRVGSNPGFALPYFVMEYIDGEPLSERLRRQGVLPPREAAEITRQVALGLAAAHERGLVHRDIKPSNILMEKSSGRARITDFGLARTVDVRSEKFTQSGGMAGTPPYMSPEQITAPQQIDHRSDIYSLGVVLYELLNGEPPFRGQTHLVLQQVVHDEPRSLRRLNDAIPRDLETICLCCLQKDPAKRYASAGAFAEDLRRFLAGEPIQARPVRAWERAVKWSKRRPVIAGLLASVVGVTALGFGLVTWQWRRAESAGEQLAAKATELAETARELEIKNYVRTIALAESELKRRVGSRADELLDQCPERLRGWEWHYLKRLPFAHFPTLEHDPFVTGVAFSADGMQLAVGDLAGNVTVWDAQTGQKRCTLTGRAQAVAAVPGGYGALVRSLVFSPDGKYLAAGGHSNLVTWWNLSTGQLLPSFSGHTSWVVGLVFSPDGRRLVSTSRDRTVRVWDVTSRHEVLKFDEHAHALAHGGLAFCADGRRVTSVGCDGLVKVWDATSGETACTFHGDVQSVSFASFSRDGRHVALGSDEGTVKIFQTEPWKEVRTLAAHATRVVRLALSPDGRRLASTGEDRVVKVWDVTTGHEALLLDVHSKRINGLAFSPDGHRLASGSADGTVKVSDGTPWVDSESGATTTWTAHEHKVVEVAFSPDSQRLVSAGWDKTVKIWDLNSGEREMSAPRLALSVHGFTAVLTGVAVSRDGRLFAAASMDGTVKICAVSTGQDICTLDGKAGPVHAVAFSPITNAVVSAHDDGTVKIWNVERGGTGPLSFQAHSDAVLGVAYSPDGLLLASAGGTGQDAVAVWEAATGKAIRKLNPSRSIKWSVAFSPNGRYLACAAGPECPVLDVATGREVHQHPIQPVDNAYRAAFSRDGRRLATACDGQTVRLWDVATGQELTALRVSGGELWGVSFSPDGRYLASCSGYKGKGTIQIWEARIWDK